MWWALLIGLIMAFYFYVKKKFNYFSSIGVPHQQGTFPFGSDVTWKMFSGKMSFVKLVDGIYDEFKDTSAKIAGYYGMLGAPIFVPIDEEIIKRILIKDFEHFMDRRTFPLHPDTNKYLLKMVSAMEGQEWKNARNQLSPIFTTTRMKGIMPVVNEVGDSFVKYLNRPETNKEDLEAKNLTQLCVAEILSRVGCGVKPNILEDKDPNNNAYYQEVKTLIGQGKGAAMMLKMMLIMMCPKIFYLLKLSWLPKSTVDTFANLIRGSIKSRQETGTRMNDFIDYLNDVAKNKDEEVEDQEDKTEFDQDAKLVTSSGKIMKNEDLEVSLIATGLLVFFAGSETTSSTLSVVFFFLANEQDLQEKLYQEIKDAIDENGGDEHLSYTKMTELKFLEAFVKESLRCWGLNFVERVCTKDYFIPELKFTIRKGSIVQIPGASIMHLEKHYPNPEKFDPEGHFDKDVLIPSNFYGFGQGPRNCVGMRFAWTIVRSVLVNVLANFKILPGPELPSKLVIDPQNMSGLPKGGVHVKLVSRK